MGAQQRLRLEVADLDAVLEHAHQHAAGDGRGPRRVAAVIDAHAVVAHGALRLGEELHAQRRQLLQQRSLLLEHGLNLAARAAVDARGCPLALPVLEEVVLLLQRLEAPPLQGRGLRVADGVLDAALAIGVTDPGRVGDHAVVRQRGGVHGVELRLVQIGLEHTVAKACSRATRLRRPSVQPFTGSGPNSRRS